MLRLRHKIRRFFVLFARGLLTEVRPLRAPGRFPFQPQPHGVALPQRTLQPYTTAMTRRSLLAAFPFLQHLGLQPPPAAAAQPGSDQTVFFAGRDGILEYPGSAPPLPLTATHRDAIIDAYHRILDRNLCISEHRVDELFHCDPDAYVSVHDPSNS